MDSSKSGIPLAWWRWHAWTTVFMILLLESKHSAIPWLVDICAVNGFPAGLLPSLSLRMRLALARSVGNWVGLAGTFITGALSCHPNGAPEGPERHHVLTTVAEPGATWRPRPATSLYLAMWHQPHVPRPPQGHWVCRVGLALYLAWRRRIYKEIQALYLAWKEFRTPSPRTIKLRGFEYKDFLLAFIMALTEGTTASLMIRLSHNHLSMNAVKITVCNVSSAIGLLGWPSNWEKLHPTVTKLLYCTLPILWRCNSGKMKPYPKEFANLLRKSNEG